MQKRWIARPAPFALSFVALIFVLHPAVALDNARVGIPATEAFSFMAVDFGNDLGIYAKNGIEVERVVLLGSAKEHQAMTAGAIDIAAGAGTDFAFLVKGAPERAVAATAGPPVDMGFVVLYDSPAKTSDDLHGKKLSTVGARALKVMARSFVDLGQLDTEPYLRKYYTEGFLPETK